MLSTNFKDDQKLLENSSIIEFESFDNYSSSSSSSNSSSKSSPSFKRKLYQYPKTQYEPKPFSFPFRIKLNLNQKCNFIVKNLLLFACIIAFVFLLSNLTSKLTNILMNKQDYDQSNSKFLNILNNLIEYEDSNESAPNLSYSRRVDTELSLFKNAINNAYLSANKSFKHCDYSPDTTIKGELKVEEILDQLNLSRLVKFHDKDTYNTLLNRYNKQLDLYYLKFDSNSSSIKNLTNETEFSEEFYNLWHSTDINLLNTSISNQSQNLVYFDQIESGGHWKPKDCISRFKIAVIIPYRDRLPHLKVLVNYLHMFLQRQMIDYRIIVAEPSIPLNTNFNKGRTMNSAYLEALKIDPSIDCVVFHDVDLLPEDDRNMYTCSVRPRHLSVAIDKFNYQLPYNYLVGGVFAIRTDQYNLTNGYSNSYWGWGGEDDDFSERIKNSKLVIERPPAKLARYKMMLHKLQKLNEQRHILLRKVKTTQKRDGLNSISYKIIEKKNFNLFTYFLIDVGSI